MSDAVEQYRLMSISEACKTFNICREEFVKCFHKGLKYKLVGTRKKVCLKWWVDYIESEKHSAPVVRKSIKKRGPFKLDKAKQKLIYSK